MAEHRDVRNLLNLHQRGGELARERLGVLERSSSGVYVDHGHDIYLLLAGIDAAASMSVTTSLGWLTITRWPAATSTVCAPIRLANIRSASDGMASSFLATRYD